MIFFDLFDRGLSFQFDCYKVIFSGNDCVEYLNNQTTNEIKKVFNTHCLLDLQGKIQASFSLRKISDKEVEIYIEKKQYDHFAQRIDKYHIVEDFSYHKEECSLILNFGKKIERENFCYKGMMVEISETPKFDLIELEKINLYLGYDNEDHLALFNATRYLDCAYSRNKGCFLGQEIISKIDVHRKSAKFPVLFKNESGFELKRVSREHRVNEKKWDKGVIYTYPVLDLSKEDLSSLYYQRGLDNYINNEHILEAIDDLKISIHLNPSNEDALESLGVMYGKIEKYNEAIDLMNKLLEKNPDSIMAHTNLSFFYMHLGQIEKAEEEKSKATLKQFQVLGNENEANEEMERKRKMFEQVLEIDSKDELANFGMGEYYYNKEEFQKSLDFFKIVISENPKHSVSYLFLSKIYKKINSILLKETLLKGIEVASKNGDFKPANEMQALLNQFGNNL